MEFIFGKYQKNISEDNEMKGISSWLADLRGMYSLE